MAGWRNGSWIVGVVLLLACATPPTDAKVEDDLRWYSADVPGLGRAPRIVVVNAGSSMDAWSRVAESTADGPSIQAQALGRDLAKGARQRIGIVIGGPFPKLNERTVLDALTASGKEALPGLTLVLVSPQPPEEDLRRVATRRRVRLIHRALPE
jgi:hypothetical protein